MYSDDNFRYCAYQNKWKLCKSCIGWTVSNVIDKSQNATDNKNGKQGYVHSASEWQSAVAAPTAINHFGLYSSYKQSSRWTIGF